jgi:hypothetical protein
VIAAAKYHETRRELVATGYANGLRLLIDQEAQKRFLAQACRPYQREIVTVRDFFREVFRTEERNQLASKHAKVASVLFENDVHPEHAAGVIERSGGIEKIARTGKLYEPVYCETADCGDGYDNWGRKLYDDDDDEPAKPTEEADEETEYEPVTRADNQQMLVEYLENMPLGEGQVGIIANYIIPNGTLLDIVDVIGSEQKILPVLITEIQSRRLQGVPPEKRARINVKKVLHRDGEAHYSATRVRRMPRPRA